MSESWEKDYDARLDQEVTEMEAAAEYFKARYSGGSRAVQVDEYTSGLEEILLEVDEYFKCRCCHKIRHEDEFRRPSYQLPFGGEIEADFKVCQSCL